MEALKKRIFKQVDEIKQGVAGATPQVGTTSSGGGVADPGL